MGLNSKTKFFQLRKGKIVRYHAFLGTYYCFFIVIILSQKIKEESKPVKEDKNYGKEK